MLRNFTITLPEEVAQWARKKAAEENTSVSELVGRMLERQMRTRGEYWRAYGKWKKIVPMKGVHASRRMSRETLMPAAERFFVDTDVLLYAAEAEDPPVAFF